MLSFHGSKADKHELHLITAVSDVALKKISAKYSCEAVEVAPDEAHGSPKIPGFASAVKAATKSAFFGFSVVGGLKEKVLALVDSTEPPVLPGSRACHRHLIRFGLFRTQSAQAIGSVDTVILSNGELVGHNTDWIAAKGALEAAMTSKGEGPVLVLGAGPEGRAVVYALCALGVPEVMMYDDNKAQLTQVVERMMAGETRGTRIYPLEGPVDESVLRCKGIVNATGKGSRDSPGTTPLTPPQLASAAKGIWLLDGAGLPLLKRTELTVKAEQRELVVSHGGKWVAGQVACRLQLVTGLKMELAAVEAALEALLAEELANVKPLIQDMPLDAPTGDEGGITGETNFAKLRAAWLEGERTESGKPLPHLEDEDEEEDALRMLVTDLGSSRRLEEPIPLRSVMDCLCDKWIADKTM